MPADLISTSLETLLQTAAPEPRRAPERPACGFGGDLFSLLTGADAQTQTARDQSANRAP